MVNEDDTDIDKEKLSVVIDRVLQAEQDKLHLKKPRGVRQDIEDIIREEID